jgi:hypothetical protein
LGIITLTQLVYKLLPRITHPSSSSPQSLAITIGAMIGSGMLVRALPYQEGIGLKQAAWILHSAVIGAVVAPLTLLGGPIMIRAACYTAGIVGGMSHNSQISCNVSVVARLQQARRKQSSHSSPTQLHITSNTVSTCNSTKTLIKTLNMDYGFIYFAYKIMTIRNSFLTASR